MTGRPPQTNPSPTALEAKILNALRAVGGSSHRNNLRTAIRPVATTAAFDDAIAALAGRGEIKTELITLTWRSPRGMDLPYEVIVYSLTKGRQRKPSTVVKSTKGRSGRPPRPPLTVAEGEDRILKALRDGGGTLGRTALRSRITQLLSLATFDEAVASLVHRGLITAERVMTGHATLIGGYIIKRQVMLYSLTKAGKKAR